MLTELGFTCEGTESAFTDWVNLPDCALLTTKWHAENGRPYWHWTVFVREDTGCYVLDSRGALKHHKRTDFVKLSRSGLSR